MRAAIRQLALPIEGTQKKYILRREGQGRGRLTAKLLQRFLHIILQQSCVKKKSGRSTDKAKLMMTSSALFLLDEAQVLLLAIMFQM